MKLNVLLFGPYADAAKQSAVDVEVPDESRATVGQVKASLAEQYPELQRMLDSAVLAVNQQAVRPHREVCETDELAVIGLVGGG